MKGVFWRALLGVLFLTFFVLPSKHVWAASGNLIQNPSFETADGENPKYWAYGGWGNNTTVFKYPVSGRSGSAASVQVSSYSNGDAKWFFEEVSVSPGEEYLFSDWSKSGVASSVVARFKKADESFTYEYLGSVSGSKSWKKFEKSLSVPTDVVAMTVFHLLEKKGTLVVDDYSLTKTAATSFAQGMVTLSFDDGFRSTYENGIPILDAAGIKSTQAIITKFFSDPNYVTAAEVKKMAASGHEIASHTRTHPDLTTLSKSKAKTEIAGSKSDLSSLGVSVSTLVYPYGTFNDTVISLAKSAGYSGARAVEDGFNTPLTDLWQLRDQHITSNVSFETVRGWIDTALAKKQWVILEMHRQEKGGSEYSNDPALLKEIVEYIKQNKVKTVTLGEGIKMLGE